MKLHKKALLIFIFLIISLLPIFSAENEIKGTELCDSMLQFLRKNHLSPQAQQLVSGGTNQFPYNIVMEFNNLPEESNDDTQMILVFKMEDAYEYKDILLETANHLKSQDFNSQILISYGENQPLFYGNTIYGSQEYIKNLNTRKNNSVYVIKLTDSINRITTGSMGELSPTRMTKDVYTSFLKEGVNKNIAHYYLSQFSRFHLFNDRLLQNFLSASLSAILLGFNSDFTKENPNTVSNVLKNIIDYYSTSRFEQNDYHSMMIRYGSKALWFNEYSIVKLLLFIISFFIVFIFLLGYINRNLENKSWREIKKNWYIIPGTFLASLAGGYVGKFIFLLLHKSVFTSLPPYTIVIWQLTFACFWVDVFYLIELLLKKDYGERSLDYLILITTFANQFLFSIADISLFPIFMFLCILALTGLCFKNNILHMILFFLMLGIFLPYIIRLYTNSSSISLSIFLRQSKLTMVTISFISLPLYLLLLRILTAIKTRYSLKKQFPFILSGTIVLMIVVMSICNNTFLKAKANTQENNLITSKNPDYQSGLEDKIHITCKDYLNFDDTIRTITIKTDEMAEYVEVKLSSQNQSPVKYSDNTYVSDTTKSAHFTIPANPPSSMSFTYGACDEASDLQVTIIFAENQSLYRIEKHLTLEGKL